jgi:hypothetical protein
MRQLQAEIYTVVLRFFTQSRVQHASVDDNRKDRRASIEVSNAIIG